MASNEGAATAGDALQQLQLSKGHKEGPTFHSWFKSEGTWHTVTGGADRRLVTRHARNHQEMKSTENTHGAWNCVTTSPDNNLVAGVDDHYVQVWRLPELTATRPIVGRFVGTPRCCCWDKDSSLVAAGGNEANLQIITVKDAKIKHRVKNEGYTRGIALDPEGQYLAAANADGTVSVWDIKEAPPNQELRKRLGPKIDPDDDVARQALAWHPDGGTLLAVAGPDNDIILLERLSWNPVAYLAGGHETNVCVVAFSPNGVYAATAGTDNKVVVWSVDKAVQIAGRQLSCTATSLSWHPQNNALLVGGSDGGVGIWNAPVSEVGAGGHKLPSPWLPVDDLLKEADRAAAGTSKAAGGSFDDFADLEDDFDDDELGQLVQRRGLAGEGSARNGTGGAEADASDLLDQLDAAAEEAAAITAAGGYGVSRFAPQAAAAGYVASKPRPPQGPIHPGSTPAGSSGGARFLAYNRLGCVVSKAVDDHHTIEVSFHDTSRHRLRVPLLTDYFNFSAASLGPRGVAYISPLNGTEQPSMLVWRGFESWTTGADWTVSLPEGENALVVAAGAAAVAIATSTRLLRIYSTAGRQIAVLNLQGQPVAMAVPDPGHILEGGAVGAACQHHLAVVWAESGPKVGCKTQQLEYTVFDTAQYSQLYSGTVALSTGTSLSWLAFSQEGLLAAMDSSKVVRLRSPQWGGSWVPVLDAAGAKTRAGADLFWPAWLDTDNLMAVVTGNKVQYPQVSPRPLITPIPLGLSTAPAEAAPSEAEEAGLRAGMRIAQLQALAEAASSQGADFDDELATHTDSSRVEADKSNLRLLTAYLKVGKQARALELVGSLHQSKSIEGALKIANHFHMPQLAEQITNFLEDKLRYEKEHEQQQQQVGPWSTNEVMSQQLNQADLENVQPGCAGHEAQTNSGLNARTKPPANIGKAAAAGQKRKTSDAIFGVSLASEPKANPFARKKVVK